MTTRSTRLAVFSIVAAAVGALPLHAQSGWRIFPSPRTSGLLEEVVKARDAGLVPVGPITVTAADGTMPEIARQEFKLESGGNTAIEALKTGCRSVGLMAPDPDQIATEPDMVCSGTWQGMRATVHVRLICQSEFLLAVEARTLSN